MQLELVAERETFDLYTGYVESDFDIILPFLLHEAYWNTWRTESDIRTQFENAWRIYTARGKGSREFLACGRVVSDGVGIAYMTDAYVLPGRRGEGMASTFFQSILTSTGTDNFRWMVHTRDAQPLYSRFGFVSYGPTYMERPSNADLRRKEEEEERSNASPS